MIGIENRAALKHAKDCGASGIPRSLGANEREVLRPPDSKGASIRRTPVEAEGVLFERQAYVVLGERLRGGARAGNVIQLRELPTLVEGVLVGKEMQHRGHPPGEALYLPD